MGLSEHRGSLCSRMRLSLRRLAHFLPHCCWGLVASGGSPLSFGDFTHGREGREAHTVHAGSLDICTASAFFRLTLALTFFLVNYPPCPSARLLKPNPSFKIQPWSPTVGEPCQALPRPAELVSCSHTAWPCVEVQAFIGAQTWGLFCVWRVGGVQGSG